MKLQNQITNALSKNPTSAPVAGQESTTIGFHSPPTLPPLTILVFAVACGLSVSNVYYAQPLLDAIASDFKISHAAIGLVVTFTQIGYGLGLLLVVPLGDLLDRRRLILGQLWLSALALIMVGSAPTATVFMAGMMAVGLLAVVVQVLVAFAATLATPAERGHVVGVVTSGVVIGILLARTVAGVLADLAGWRSVYFVTATLMLLMGGILFWVLPHHENADRPANYGQLLRSMLSLFVQEPLVRVRAGLAFFIFASFSILWTSMVLPLSAPPLSLSHTEIGLWALSYSYSVQGVW